MTTYTPLSDSTLAQKKPLPQSVARAGMRDNLKAVTEGDPSAPKIQHAALYEFEAGDTLLVSSDAEIDYSFSNTNYTKVREVMVPRNGTIRVSFDLRSQGVQTVNAILRINGSDVGTLRTKNNTTYSTFTEDLTVQAGDLVQLFARAGGANSPSVRNFRLFGTNPWQFQVNL